MSPTSYQTAPPRGVQLSGTPAAPAGGPVSSPQASIVSAPFARRQLGKFVANGEPTPGCPASRGPAARGCSAVRRPAPLSALFPAQKLCSSSSTSEPTKATAVRIGSGRGEIDPGHPRQVQRLQRAAGLQHPQPALHGGLPLVLDGLRDRGRDREARRVRVRVEPHVVVRLAHPGQLRVVVDLDLAAPELFRIAPFVSDRVTAVIGVPCSARA